MTLAAEPKVMWRTGDSGVLVAPSATVPSPGQGGGEVDRDLILEAVDSFYFYTSGGGNQMTGFNAVNGSEPFTFSISGQLPSGLEFLPNSNGLAGNQAVIKGKPTQADANGRAVTVSVVDANGKTAQRTVRIGALGSPMMLDGSTRPVFTVGQSTSWTYQTQNAVGAVTYRLFGRLPAGIALDTANGRLMGAATPGSEGTYNLSIQAVDSLGQAAMLVLTITVS